MPQFPFEFEDLSEDEYAARKTLYTGPHSLMVDMVRSKPGNVYMPRSYKDLAERVYNMEVRPDDIFMITYPKAGSTWTQEMIWQIANGVDLEEGKKNVFLRAPFLEITMLCGSRAAVPSLESDNPADRMKAFMADSVGGTVSFKGRRVIKTHLPLEFLPPNVLDVAKVICVARNAKDSLVSWYHHESMLPPHGLKPDSFNELAKLYMKGEVLYGDYFNHIKSLWKVKDHPNVKFVWYEDMNRNLRSVIEDLNGFLNVNMSEEKLVQLLDHLAFDNFKKNDAVNMKPPKGSVPDEVRDKTNFIRKGKVGNWKEYFSDELVAQFDAWIAKNNADFKIDFQFE